MRVVIQTLKNSTVLIDKNEERKINQGLLVLLGIENSDTKEDILWTIKKVLNMRIFSDQEGKMNLSVEDISGEIMVISQFTLFASTKKGNRPSYIRSAKPDIAIPIYEDFLENIKESTNLRIVEGKFGADMQITLHNDGPVTIIMDSKNKE